MIYTVDVAPALPCVPRRFFYRMDEEAPMGLPDDSGGGSYQSIQVRAFSSWQKDFPSQRMSSVRWLMQSSSSSDV